MIYNNSSHSVLDQNGLDSGAGVWQCYSVTVSQCDSVTVSQWHSQSQGFLRHM